LKKFLFTDTQKFIFAFSLFFVVFANYAFLSKLVSLASAEGNNIVIFTVPLVLFAIFVLIFNILLLITYKYSFKILLSFFTLAAGLSSYFMNTFGTIIDKDMMVNAVRTDSAEVFALITPKLIAYFVFLVVLPIFVIIRTKIEYKSYPKEILNKLIFICIGLAFIGASYMTLSKNYSSFFRNHNELRFYTNPTYPLYSITKFVYLQTTTSKKLIPIGLDAKLTPDSKKRLFVLVVGETARADNFSLNGYSVKTNPLMEELQNKNEIVNLTNFTSCGTATATSVPCLFSKFSKSEYDDDKQYYENLVDVVNRVGVKVIWIDNNSGGSQGVANRIKDAKYFGGGKTFDQELLKELEKSLENSYQDTLVVLHQEGSHGPTYYQRYPNEFKKLTPTCDTQDLEKCTQQQIVNTYNNTIAYTDFFLNETIKMMKKYDEKYKTTMMYFSDHGESLGENGIYLHGLPYMLAPDTQKHVPAILWFGKDFNKEKIILNSKKTSNLSHDNVFHTTLGFFGITTKEYNKSLDLFQ